MESFIMGKLQCHLKVYPKLKLHTQLKQNTYLLIFILDNSATVPFILYLFVSYLKYFIMHLVR